MTSAFGGGTLVREAVRIRECISVANVNKNKKIRYFVEVIYGWSPIKKLI